MDHALVQELVGLVCGMEGDKVGVWGDECNEDGMGMVLYREDNMEDTPWGRWAVEV